MRLLAEALVSTRANILTNAIVIAIRSYSDRYMIPFLLLVALLGILTAHPRKERRKKRGHADRYDLISRWLILP